MKSIPVVDLFAGPGGLGEGFSSLTDTECDNIFEIILSVEKDPVAYKTLELRSFFRKFPLGNAPEEYYQYLRKEISRENLFDAFLEEAEAAKKEAWCATLGSGEDLNCKLDERIRRVSSNYGDKWVLIGGPPCQAYSTVGRARRKNLDSYCPEKDDRNFLYREYLRILSEHHPAVFVMENVKGILSSKVNGCSMFDKILEDLGRPSLSCNGKQKSGVEYEIYSLSVPFSGFAKENSGYISTDFIIKSEEYGIPQARHRVILLGVKKGLINNPPEILKKKNNPLWVRDVLSGLPPLRSGLSREKDLKGR